MKVAEEMFAQRQFHEVKLEDIARKARIGKGTIYIYFQSKEDLLRGLLREGMGQLLDRVRQRASVSSGSSMNQLREVVSELAQFANERPHMYRLLRVVLPEGGEPKCPGVRKELVSIVEDVIRRGITRREMRDTQPHLTAQYILSVPRGVALFAPGRLSSKDLTDHMMGLFEHGLGYPERGGR